MASKSQMLWLRGARPRTWPASLVPVVVGTAAVAPDVIWWRASLALVVALALQVGVNYANDYSDGIRGTDANRLGPARLVGGGMATSRAVRLAAFVSFGVAAGAGLALALATTWLLLLIGVVCVLAAWFYTGGKYPYGYYGFGELSVFVFFGLVGTAGTAFVQVEQISGLHVAAGVPVGLMCCAILMANNLRDIPQDQQSAKLTLAVRFGEKRAAWAYVVLVYGAIGAAAALAPYRWWAPLSLIALAFAQQAACVALADGDKARLLNQTARLHLILGCLLTLALLL
ncbi:MAG: 1,4-dihydroxy-2-naphthoate polyprenyltransferase [Acidimicrobiia bacterium]|nr:1,4-dihydroxy-2-naphthoate polyprenyltransferase [Acidimicrobiia bacterium]